MDDSFKLIPYAGLRVKETQALKQCNEITARFGLVLSDEQVENIVQRRFEALKFTGRIEFGEGIMKKLIVEFCDSPYIWQENYDSTIIELQDIFYSYKNESLDAIADDDLIQLMKHSFDNECQGSLEYLRETTLEEMCRGSRNPDDEN